MRENNLVLYFQVQQHFLQFNCVNSPQDSGVVTVRDSVGCSVRGKNIVKKALCLRFRRRRRRRRRCGEYSLDPENFGSVISSVNSAGIRVICEREIVNNQSPVATDLPEEAYYAT